MGGFGCSVDSSEYQRNGDLSPSRLQAEIDAANLISQCKLRSNAENNVGLIAMQEGVEVLTWPNAAQPGRSDGVP